MEFNFNLFSLGSVLMLPLSASAVTLVEIDFSGTGAVGSIAAADAEFTTKNPAVTFDDTASTLTSVGGSSNTSSWVYDGTGAAATNPDLHTGSTFGGPTRFDVDLGFAAVGLSYTITSVEIDVRASNSAGTEWEFGYRKASDSTTQLIGAQSISTQSGADPISTYSIDLTSENLVATDATTAWSTAGNGELRFLFYEPTATGNDNLQIDSVRVIGTVIPEPSGLTLLGLAGLTLALRRRR